VIGEAAKALATLIHSAAGTQLVCRRGVEAIEVDGTPGQTTFQTVDDNGAVQQFQSRDFLILAEQYAFGGRRCAPERGDRIQETIGGIDKLYEVMSPDLANPPFRYCDIQQTLLRVHTKLVKGRVNDTSNH
jgi:hypothetical protein